jgi:actin-like ATPase involved in cell morphogenesis
VGYALGVDLGTTFTAAAIAEGGRAQIFELSSDLAAIPSVVYAAADGSFLVGEPAVRRARSDPDRVAREFKRRLGGANLLLGGTPFSAHVLMAKLLAATTRRVTEQRGTPPERVVLTYPANWGEYKIDLLRQAARMCDLEANFVPEPEAAAIAYAHSERMAPGETVIVYDLGGGTFDAAVLAKTDTGFDLLGRPDGIEQLGGMDFDDAVYQYVLRALPTDRISQLDYDDEVTVGALTELRAESVAAKEALSDDTQAEINVLLPTVQTQIRLTREEFETLIRPDLDETIAALRRALRSAALEPEQVERVLLVGGSSRIPLVAQLLAATVGRPVAVDAHPKHAIATGAALFATEMEVSPQHAVAERVVSSGSGQRSQAPQEPLDPPPRVEEIPPSAETSARAATAPVVDQGVAPAGVTSAEDLSATDRSARRAAGATAILFGALLQVPGALDTVAAQRGAGRALSAAVVLLAIVALFIPLIRWLTIGLAGVAVVWQLQVASGVEDTSVVAASVAGIVLCALGALVAPSARRRRTAAR